MNIKLKKIQKIIILMIIITIILSNYLSVYATDEISINAKSAIMVEVNTGKIIYEKNANEQNFPASVTKILTAILVLEKCELNDTAIVSKKSISNIPSGYVVAPLFEGEKISIEDLLYALMLKSANDAAYVLAEHVGGSVDGFSDMMNRKAKEIGCTNTHFVNPNGIHDEEHYTTAYDLYLISKYAMENKTFEKIVSTYEYTLSATNKYVKKDRVMQSTNYFLNPKSKFYNENVKGIKTGTTLQAGNCLITNINKDGFNYISVVLGAKTSDGRFTETQKIINYAFDNYIFSNLNKKGDIIKNIEVDKATKETKNLNLVINDDVTIINNKKINVKEIEPEVILNENIVAPINKGQELGTIKYTVDGLEYSAKLLAENDVELKTYYIEILIGSVIAFCIFIIFVKKRKNNR
ncbi:MAG: D-alanyl-D-alanine carboxypeptidase [Clostridia bacterium]|nr:D-alanyl-D-alanine carboxypeptidase [Clostridia bacterium]